MDVKLEWKSSPDVIIKRIFDSKNLPVMVPEVVARHMDKYVPMDTGTLAQTYETGDYKVTYTQPYARRLFYGEGFNFNREKHTQATARWDIATQNAKINAIAKEINTYMNRG